MLSHRFQPCTWDEIVRAAGSGKLLRRCGAVVCACHYLEQALEGCGVRIEKGQLAIAIRTARDRGLLRTSESDVQLTTFLRMRNDLVHGSADYGSAEIVSAIKNVRQVVLILRNID